MKDTILTVISDQLLRAKLTHTLSQRGFDVVNLLDPASVCEQIRRQFAVLVVASLPEPRLLELCRDIRRGSDIPVLVQIPELNEQREWMCFQAGASEVVSTDISRRVLLARIDALVHRHGSKVIVEPRTLCVGPLFMDLDARSLLIDDHLVQLTRTEFDLLARLMAHPRRVHNRGDLVQAVWGEFQPDHVLETHLCRMRKKIRAVGGPHVGEAVRGIGYRLGIDAAIEAKVS